MSDGALIFQTHLRKRCAEHGVVAALREKWHKHRGRQIARRDPSPEGVGLGERHNGNEPMRIRASWVCGAAREAAREREE